MEAIISNMLTRFEKGSLSRRDLISGLSMLAAGAASAEAAQTSGLKGLTIDHISIQVSDLQKSIAFYQNVFGLSIMSEDKPNEIVRMGTRKIIVSLHHKPPTGIMDHYAIAIDGFDKEAVTRALKQQGLTAEENLDYGCY